jgi:hypothetical protein
MKKLFYLFIINSFFISCTNDNDGTKQRLPNITTEGKNTFGCKTDGIVFLPKSRGGFSAGYRTPILYANYTHITYKYYDLEPGYYLRISAYNELTTKDITIEMSKSDEPIIEGKSYQVKLKGLGSISSNYGYWGKTVDTGNGTGFIPVYSYSTTNDVGGEIKILKLDLINKIISGTFWFDCKNDDLDVNEVAKITEGRFDLKFQDYIN